MDTLALLRPFIDLLDVDQDTKDRVAETARIYFQNDDSSVTVNLIPALIVSLLGLILLLKWLGLPILSSFGLDGLVGGDDGGYGHAAVDDGYGYASSSYSRSSNFQETVDSLQAQITALQESNNALNNQLYFNPASAADAVNSNQIGYTS